MRYTILALIALSPITAISADLPIVIQPGQDPATKIVKVISGVLPMIQNTTEPSLAERTAQNEKWLEAVEKKFEALYPRANLALVYCRAQLVLNRGGKITESVLEPFYRTSDNADEIALVPAQAQWMIIRAHCEPKLVSN